MGKIGNYEYPDTKFEEILRIINIFESQLQGKVENPNSLATAVGHESVKSSTFYNKITDARRYGLIEPREWKTTPIAKKLTYPNIEQERDNALREAIFRVELWKLIYEKSRNSIPDDAHFRVILQEITKEDRGVIAKESDKIRKLYIGVVSRLGGVYPTESTQQVNKPEQANKPITLNENMIEGKAGNVYIAMPKNSKSIEIAKKLIDILSMQIENNEENQTKSITP